MIDSGKINAKTDPRPRDVDTNTKIVSATQTGFVVSNNKVFLDKIIMQHIGVGFHILSSA